MQNEKLWQTRSRGNKLRGYGAQTPNVHLRGQGTDFNYCLFLCPRRRLLGVCAPQRRTSVPRSLFPRSNTLQSPRCCFAGANGWQQQAATVMPGPGENGTARSGDCGRRQRDCQRVGGDLSAGTKGRGKCGGKEETREQNNPSSYYSKQRRVKSRR